MLEFFSRGVETPRSLTVGISRYWSAVVRLLSLPSAARYLVNSLDFVVDERP